MDKLNSILNQNWSFKFIFFIMVNKEIEVINIERISKIIHRCE
jgi:hypothetical protein